MAEQERPGPATGRRGNGLPAATWSSVGDVDPRQAGDLLTALAGAGIAAYVTPSTGSVGAYLSVHLPQRPLDRLHVDAARRDEAVALIRAELADERPPTADDVAFAAIVAGWDLPSAAPVAPWPVSEDAEPSARADGEGDAEGSTVLRPARPAPAPDPAADHSAEHSFAEEHYVAPPPPPLPRWQRPTLVCVLAVVVGFAVLAWTSITGAGSQLWLVLGVLFIAGGTAGLVARLRDHSEDDDSGDGAVV